MSMNIRFPNITAATEKEQINQIKSYLHQLVEQLNWVLGVLETSIGSASGSDTTTGYGDISEEMFYELKSLLIQSSDTLNAYYEKINSKLEGQYVSQTEFDEHEQELSKRFDDLADHYVAHDDFNAYKEEVSQQFDGLGEQYVAQNDYDEYKQEVSQSFEDLGNQYVSQEDFEAYKQEVAEGDDEPEVQYVTQADFDVYKQEVTEAMEALQESIEALRLLIEPNEETGGEENG